MNLLFPSLQAKPLINTNNAKEIIDPFLGDNYDSEKMDRIILTASLCTEQSPILRPRMSQASIDFRMEKSFHLKL